MLRSILYFLSLFFICTLNSQSLQINEVLSKNYSNLVTAEGIHEDWIELYNNSMDTILLKDFYLSDDINLLNKYKMPDVELNPNSYQLIFASNKLANNNELHCNFKLDSDGDLIILSKGDIIIDSFSIPKLLADISYGRIDENNNIRSILDLPTPMASNSLSNHLTFSHNSGFYSTNFKLTVNNLKSNHDIRYTFDGSEPNINSNIYNGEILVEDRTFLPNGISTIRTTPYDEIFHHNWDKPLENISKITSIKFLSFYNEEKTSKIYTQNYLIDIPLNEITSISITTDSFLLFDNDVGIYVPGKFYNSDYPNFTGNYFKNVQIKANLSYFDKNNIFRFSQDCNIRIKGKTTRASAQKSFKVYAKKEFGEKYFSKNILENNLSKNKRFILRNTQGSYAKNVISDDLCNEIIKDLNIDHSRSQFCRVYLNGEYWGIFSLRNELDEFFFSEKYNLSKENINIANADFSKDVGDNKSLLNLKKYLNNNSLVNSIDYKYVSSVIDIDSYIDYQISEIFFSNLDWLGNNSKLWKSNQPLSKWRYVFYDSDASLVDFDKNMFKYCIASNSTEWRNAPELTLLFRKLLENQEFKMKFINRFLNLLETNFSYENTLKSFNKILKVINPEIEENFERWHYPSPQEDFIENIENTLIKFLSKRNCIVKHQLNDFFNLSINEFPCEPDYKKEIQFVIYPNPNHGCFNIQIKSENTTTFLNYYIYNSIGQIVKNDKSQLSSESTFIISENSLKNGLYSIKIYGNNKYWGISKLLIN